jgi:hypothetical protein
MLHLQWLCLQAARRERLIAREREAMMQRRRVPMTMLYSVIAVLVLLNIGLWVHYGESFSRGQEDVKHQVFLFLVPAVTLLMFIMILKRRATAREAPPPLPQSVRAMWSPNVPQMTSIVMHPQPRVAPASTPPVMGLQIVGPSVQPPNAAPPQPPRASMVPLRIY